VGERQLEMVGLRWHGEGQGVGSSRLEMVQAQQCKA